MVEPVANKVEKMSVNRIINGFCSNCLKVVDNDHQGYVMRCHKCHQEGHRLAEFTITVTGGSDNKP